MYDACDCKVAAEGKKMHGKQEMLQVVRRRGVTCKS